MVRTRREECRGVCDRNSRRFSFGQGQLTVPMGLGIELKNQTSVARAILSALDHIPTVLILSQDSFYRRHTPEEVKLAFDNDLDLGRSQGLCRHRMSADIAQIILIRLILLSLQR